MDNYWKAIRERQSVVDRMTTDFKALGRAGTTGLDMEKLLGVGSVVGSARERQSVVDRMTTDFKALGRAGTTGLDMEKLLGVGSIGNFVEMRQSAMAKIAMDFKRLGQTNNYSFSVGIESMDNILLEIETDFKDLDIDRSRGSNQELVDWLTLLLENCIIITYRLKEMYNTLNTKKVFSTFLVMVNLVGTVMTIITFLKDDPPEVHIHNYIEDAEIETEFNGNRVDIYIKENNNLNDEVPIEIEK